MTLTAPYLRNRTFWLYASGLLLITVIAYCRVFSAAFISWDDGELLLNNPEVHNFKVSAFFSSQYTGNYMPVTMLLYATDWKLFHHSAAGHHAVPLLLHCLNGLLVLVLGLRLFGKVWPAVLSALIFCIHPLQVESVAWIAETKTVLCTLFFLFATERYLDYLDTGDKKMLYIKTLLLFVLAALSKPAALCFPLAMLCFDLIKERKFSVKIFTEKIPFFLIAVFLGIVTIYTQTQASFINKEHKFGIFQKIGYAGYALFSYTAKLLLPIGQSVIYPYPAKAAVAIGIGYFFIFVICLGIYFLVKKKKLIPAGTLLLALAGLVLVLQLVPFGEVLTADRYMYISLIGFGFTFAWLLRNYESTARAISLAIAVVFFMLSFVRTKVWQNGIQLYSDIISKYPNSAIALNSLGAEYMLIGELRKAHEVIDRAIAASPQLYKAYYNNGLLYSRERNYTEALKNFDRAISLHDYTKALVGRAGVYYELKDYARAINDATQVLTREPANYRAHYILGNCFSDLNQLDKALYSYDRAISMKSDEAEFYFRRAIVKGKMQRFSDCLADLEVSTEINPEFAEAFYWKGVARVNLKKNPCTDFQKALNLGYEGARNPLFNYCK